MFRRVLIANRGEIALRVIRACRDLGIETVAVYSEADRNSSYLRLADHTVCIGPGPARESYLDIPRIISAAEITNVDAIHPGYGFLSENPEFSEICEQCNIRFIGPPAEATRTAGDKVQARELAKKVKIPTIPGSEGPVEDEKGALEIAKGVGYPVMIKAAGGGGGRGMRVVHNDVTLVQSFLKAQTEVAAAFKNSALYVEKYIPNARHIEVQILADRHGNIVHLGERDCTVQRRFQKLIEEAPSPAITPSLRKDLGNAAVAFAKACKYQTVGTVEFLVDDKGRFYFIEMNSRIQVEHPVTEMVTGIDLVQEQIKAASDEKLSISQRDVSWNGFAIECRINAEDPTNGFRPCPGRITRLQFPGGPGVRVDSHAFAGYEVPPFYDSLVAKVIVHRKTHNEAVAAARQAMRELVVEGIKTTAPLHLSILNHPLYINGQINTGFVDSVFGRGTTT
jgi:acetyl-CoA carboxylase biotin carboxylase subunit